MRKQQFGQQLAANWVARVEEQVSQQTLNFLTEKPAGSVFIMNL